MKGFRTARRQATTYVKLLRGLAQSRVVLLNEVPADLILTEVAVVGAGFDGRSRGLVVALVVLGHEATVGRHDDWLCDGLRRYYERCRGGQKIGSEGLAGLVTET